MTQQRTENDMKWLPTIHVNEIEPGLVFNCLKTKNKNRPPQGTHANFFSLLRVNWVIMT